MVGQYELGKVIGAGAFSKVRLATKVGNKDEMYAVKVVNKDSIRDIRDLDRSPFLLLLLSVHLLAIAHSNTRKIPVQRL